MRILALRGGDLLVMPDYDVPVLHWDTIREGAHGGATWGLFTLVMPLSSSSVDAPSIRPLSSSTPARSTASGQSRAELVNTAAMPLTMRSWAACSR